MRSLAGANLFYMKTLLIDEIIDMVAKPETEVQLEVMTQTGGKGKLVLYIHVDGKTVLRIGHIPRHNLKSNLNVNF